MTNFLITGAAGFIGSAVCRQLLLAGNHRVVAFDKLTYAGSKQTVRSLLDDPAFTFVEGDICDADLVLELLKSRDIECVMHLAAESHVDRSIIGPSAFIETNIVGTFQLLQASLKYYDGVAQPAGRSFRFHHVSTDEVFGDLAFDASVFNEATPYNPSSPYSASKAASDHLVNAWHHTYKLPAVISNCSNNYGPYQFPEKLMPMILIKALSNQPLPIYGTGENVRDWLYVDDHARALIQIAQRGALGNSYLVGGREERTNMEVVKAICSILDQKTPRADGASYAKQIAFVEDRKGHDRRYAIDPSKTERDLNWSAEETFETGLEKTVDWYLNNKDWWDPLLQRLET